MIKKLLIVIFGGIALTLNGQNLILNGSFENYVGGCSDSQPNGDFHNNVIDWYSAGPDLNHGYSSVDLYCGQANYGGCLPGPNLTGSDGAVYAGFHTRVLTPPYNEAIYQILNTPLTQGATYNLSLDLMTCQSGLFNGTDDLHVYSNIDSIFPICPTNSPTVQLLQTIPHNTINKTQWQTNSLTFVAPANCNVIIFSGTCAATQTYYYIDNIILTPTGCGLQITTTQVGSPACGAQNGSATATANGGSVPYTYQWDNGETSQTATNLTIGIHTVTVSDANNCSETAQININGGPPPVSLSINQIDAVTCFENNNGTATVVVNGGTPSFTYLWDNGEATATAISLSTGLHVVTVTDSSGCIETASVNIPGPARKLAITADILHASCNLSNGEITINTTGGTPGYSYLWSANANAQTTPDITGLGAGTYTVSVTDDRGCCSIVSLVVRMDNCCTNPSTSCIDAIQGTLDICVEISTNPNTPLTTIDCDGDGVTNADECNDSTNPLDPCDYVDTSITLPVIANQNNCPQPCPDLTPTTTVLPGNIAGYSQVQVAIEITELDGIDTDGSIISIRIPSDPRLLFVWNIGLTQAASIPVQNSIWNYLGDNGIFHSWEYNGSGLIISGGSKSAFGFVGFYDPQSTNGQTTITATIVPFSGGDCRILNNVDSERLVYFN